MWPSARSAICSSCGIRFVKSSVRGQGRLILCLLILMLLTSLIVSFAYTVGESSVVGTSLGSLHHQLFYSKKNSRELRECHFAFNDTSKGPIEADTVSVPGIHELEEMLGPDLMPGGHFVPRLCRSKTKVAIIIPFRDRRIHLKIFLRHMHPFLQRQNVEYGIFVVEQEGVTPFNRAILLNIGYVESEMLHHYDCFIFHDVDLLPLDDRNIYACSENPVHLSASIDTHDFKLMYNNLFGGVSALTKEMMLKVNGFSNIYFGWGGEDDDMSYRVRSHGMDIERYIPEVARYTMMKHAKADGPSRYRLFASSRDRIHSDGINTLKYERIDIQLLPLYTWILVRINESEILEPFGL
ncbi:beta-1,4-N-acetylgalactosaminyltransferase bre-4 [Aplysia californica]|uniref:Beta-1,4-galactosyltransferase n=1 Tax=Aplysia californica TaxID=6500 RepID=A0ABM0JPR8_APLCA|nr:beta-1,4-N-acetylgalactosaminyltransferase bre-4 [Aplysia californica]